MTCLAKITSGSHGLPFFFQMLLLHCQIIIVFFHFTTLCYANSSLQLTSNDVLNINPSKNKAEIAKSSSIAHSPSNTTAQLNNRFELRCSSGKLENDVQWYVMKESIFKKITKIGHNFRIHQNGSLIFRKIEKNDEGVYRCDIQVPDNSENGEKHYSYVASVIVESKVKIQSSPDVIRKEYGTSVKLNCAATGIPAPVIDWIRSGNKIVQGTKYSPYSYYSRSSLTINVTETTNYTCKATNQMSSERSYDQKSFMVYVSEKVSDTDGKESKPKKCQGYCAPYNGRVCRRYLPGRGLVWFNISQDSSGGWLNEQITESLWKELISNLIEPCRSAAEALLCKYAFPDCALQDSCAIGLPLCYEDCVALRSHYCFNDWALIMDNKRKDIFIEARGHFRLPICEKLPKYNNKSKICTKSSITTMRYEMATTSCMKGNGRFYQGSVNQTHEGVSCQPWFTSFPHTQTTPENIFPEMRNAGNNCRNPGGTEPEPWCYTVDPLIRWQYCSIPKCDNVSKSFDYYENEGYDTRIREDYYKILMEVITPEFIGLLVSVGIATVAIIVITSLICANLCRKKSGYTQANVQNIDIDLDKLPENAAYHQTSGQINPRLEKLEYPRNDIIYIRDVGQGAFGRVFQGKAPGLKKGEEFTMVAVKMLKEEATDDLLRDFEKEAILLSEFDHPNIVRLYGVCAIGKPMCLLFEYMAKGDLNSYLRSNTPDNYIVRKPNGISLGSNQSSFMTDIKVSHVEQVSISKQICNGMVYLSDRKYVHRDLASRNCLIDQSGTVKIADFGLSQRVSLQEYFRGDVSDNIPIRWMPLEAVLHNKYTIESDIWAFGILLWEIFSLALQPYYGLSNEEVIKFLKEGNTLGCPENTPKSIYKIMKSCWNPNPSVRPMFRILHRELETIEKELTILQRHYKSQKSIVSVESMGRMTPQSPKSFE
uniref:receptor protein-tyrosine kinase n=1 Tax=Lepeophtheirus salmonis TaxID=72036 RepID=A0A0K2T6A4_LEPSM